MLVLDGGLRAAGARAGEACGVQGEKETWQELSVLPGSSSGQTLGSPRCLPEEGQKCVCAVSQRALAVTIRSDPERRAVR